MKTPPPVRWLDSPPEDRPDSRVLDLLDKSSTVDEWPDARYARVLRRVDATLAEKPRSHLAWGGAGAALAAAAAAALVLVVLRTAGGPAPAAVAWRTVSLGELGSLEVTPAAVLRLETEPAGEADERRAYVLAGSARAHIAKQDPRRPFVLVTPHLRVVVVGTRFTVDVADELTTVSVQEGRVRLESPAGGTLAIGVGERIDSNDARLSLPAAGAAMLEASATPEPSAPAIPPVPSPGAAPRVDGTGCPREGSVAERRRCLSGLAGGEGLQAQNALYELGKLSRDVEGDPAGALRAWRTYERRFPDGVLAPEVSVAILRALLDSHRYPEALVQAERFRDRFEGDTRGSELALIRAKLLCTQFGRLREAQRAFDEALQGAGPAVREDALYARGACLELLSGAGAAQSAWRQYLREFPEGPHARAVRARVAH